MSTDPAYYRSQLNSLKARFDALIANNEECREHDKHEEQDENLKKLTSLLQDYTSLVKQADDAAVSDLQSIVAEVNDVFNEALSYAYGDADMCDMFPSFAHGDSLIKDKLPPGVFSSGLLDAFLPFLERVLGTNVKADARARGVPMPKRPQPWTKTLHPHPNTTPCSRFRDDIPTWNSNESNPKATFVYEARCDMSSYDIHSPVSTALSAAGTCIALLSAGGYKNRTPYLSYWLPHQAFTGDFPAGHNLAIGFSDIARFITIDDERKLIFAGDDERAKSFAWGTVGGNTIFNRPLPTHTFDTDRYTGPMLVLPGGRFVRAGKGCAGLWDLESAPTHGPKGKTIIGKTISTEDSWRDDPEDIEQSEGSPADSVIPFEDKELVPHVWKLHPVQSGTLFCSADPKDNDHNYSCVTVDLEHGGKTGSRYLGHGGTILNFSTSTEDPNCFVTSCTDGLARLYDVRHPLPALTLDAADRSSACTSAVIAHPDGYPFIFTGYDTKEHIVMWDVRGRAPIYDLSTGNNEVISMEWNASENSLYASTTCNYIDRLGYHHDYRVARVPRRRDVEEEKGEEGENQEDDNDDMWEDDDEDENEDEDDDEEEYEETDEEMCWPKRAHHSENYYGEVFDAGDHRMYRYHFNAEASGVVPPYGNATIRSDDGMW